MIHCFLGCPGRQVPVTYEFRWFFDEFLTTEEMTKERDGKVAGELLVKALHKVDTRQEGGPKLNLPREYDARRQGRNS